MISSWPCKSESNKLVNFNWKTLNSTLLKTVVTFILGAVLIFLLL